MGSHEKVGCETFQSLMGSREKIGHENFQLRMDVVVLNYYPGS